jgi:hypothetical protein
MNRSTPEQGRHGSARLLRRDESELTDLETDQTWKRRRAALTRRAVLYGSLAVAALIIFAVNLLVMIRAFWEPSLLMGLPLYMMFAAVSLWAGVNFLQTRSKMLSYRDRSACVEDDEVDLNL